MDAKAALWETGHFAKGRKGGIFKHELTGIKGMRKIRNTERWRMKEEAEISRDFLPNSQFPLLFFVPLCGPL